jgi:hypothetical protein
MRQVYGIFYTILYFFWELQAEMDYLAFKIPMPQ